MKNLGITIGGVTFLIFVIKMGIDPDNKARYIKLAKNTIIASVLITLSLTLLQIPKDYFGNAIGVADEGTGEVTFAKIEDKDCQNRETINIDGKRYVVTDTNKKIATVKENEPFEEAFGIYIGAKTLENVSFLRPFNECQGFWKGYYSRIAYYRDSEGFIFPSSYTYLQYIGQKGLGENFTKPTDGEGRIFFWRRCLVE